PTYRFRRDKPYTPQVRIHLILDLVVRSEGETALGPPSATAVRHLEACLVCRACETACPSGVPFGRIMEGAREELRVRDSKGGFTEALGRAALDTVAHEGRLAFLTRLTDLAHRLGLMRLAVRLGGRLGWAASLAPRSGGPAFRLGERAG